ncbi:MAG: hypothetical protein QOD06_775 [Candidatus Binatota bacterium]|jgi:hypothetical protein|nr:hypothetical protein [Candidatus Binatota bacterium]
MLTTTKKTLGAAAFALSCSAIGVNAEDATISDRVKALEEKVDAIGVDFGGMIYGSYQYNFNDPEDDHNTLRSLDPEANSFTFDLFQLQINKEGPAGVAFGSKLDFGKTASRIASDWNGDGALDSSEETNDFEVEEAYLTWAPTWAGGGSVKAGKFVTLLGSEVIEAPLNPNFTRSFLFGFAIPFTHTGLLFTAPITDQVTVNAGVVNGWDNVVDNNDGKTFLGNIAFLPTSTMSFYANGVFGPEKTDDDGGPRGVLDLVSSLTFDPVTLSMNFDYGSEGDAAPDGGSAKWTGFSGIAGLALADLTGLPAGVYVRGEVFDDSDGARTGTKQTLTEFTFTGKYFVNDHLTLWGEFRHDDSDEDSFVDEGPVVDDTPQFTGSQDTALAAISFVF